jgi:hypothetical protein
MESSGGAETAAISAQPTSTTGDERECLAERHGYGSSERAPFAPSRRPAGSTSARRCVYKRDRPGSGRRGSVARPPAQLRDVALAGRDRRSDRRGGAGPLDGGDHAHRTRRSCRGAQAEAVERIADRLRIASGDPADGSRSPNGHRDRFCYSKTPMCKARDGGMTEARTRMPLRAADFRTTSAFAADAIARIVRGLDCALTLPPAEAVEA